MKNGVEQRLQSGGVIPDAAYDEVMFDVGEEPPPMTPKRTTSTKPMPSSKPIKINSNSLMRKKQLKAQPSWKSGKKEEVEEDRVSLDSYEDMNGTQGEEDAPVPPQRAISLSPPPPDPSTRAKVWKCRLPIASRRRLGMVHHPFLMCGLLRQNLGQC